MLETVPFLCQLPWAVTVAISYHDISCVTDDLGLSSSQVWQKRRDLGHPSLSGSKC